MMKITLARVTAATTLATIGKHNTVVNFAVIHMVMMTHLVKIVTRGIFERSKQNENL